MQALPAPQNRPSNPAEAHLAFCREGFLKTLREAVDEVIRHPDWLEVLTREAGHCFDEVAGRRGRNGGGEDRGITASRLSLVHDQDMDYVVELTNLEQRLRNFCARELAALHLRLRDVFEAAGRTLGKELPVGPEVVIAALRALRDMERLSAEEALQLIRQLEPALGSHLCAFYRALEHRLSVSAPTPAPQGSPESRGPSRAAGPAGPALEGNLPLDDPLASLRSSVLARRDAGARNGGLNSALALVLVERLETWLSERQQYGEGIPASLGGSELGALLDAPQAAAVEVVETVCNYALGAADLPAAIREIIGQLRVPLLRLALRSESLLDEPRHPALRLIDLIADLGRSMAPDCPADRPVCQALWRLVQSLGKAPRVSDKDMQAALDQARALLDTRKHAALARAAACVPAASRLERREVALVQAGEAIQALAAGPMDPVAREFIEGYWVHVLAKVAFRYGPGGPKWTARLQVAERLLEATRPDQDEAAARPELMARMPALLAGLEEGLRYIGLDEARRQEGLAPCQALLAALIAGRSRPAPLRRAPVDPSLSVVADVPGLCVLRHKQFHAGELQLPAGWPDVDMETPVAIALPDGQVMRGFVALIGPAQQLLLVADGDSDTVLAVTARALAQQAALPATRVFRGSSLVDEAATDRLIHP